MVEWQHYCWLAGTRDRAAYRRPYIHNHAADRTAAVDNRSEKFPPFYPIMITPEYQSKFWCTGKYSKWLLNIFIRIQRRGREGCIGGGEICFVSSECTKDNFHQNQPSRFGDGNWQILGQFHPYPTTLLFSLPQVHYTSLLGIRA